MPGFAGGPIKHPRGDLQPAIGRNAGQTTTKCRLAGLLNDLVDINMAACPWLPGIEKLTLISPVGVL